MRTYDHNGALVQSLRQASRWGRQRFEIRAYRDELSRRVQLALIDAGRPMTPSELAPLVRAPEGDVVAAMHYCQARGWLEFV